MTPDHPSRPPGPEAFDGQGILLTLQVPDAASEFERVRTSGLFVDHPLRSRTRGVRGDSDFETRPASGWTWWSRSTPSRAIGIRTPDRFRPPTPSDRACGRTRAPCRRPHASRCRSSERAVVRGLFDDLRSHPCCEPSAKIAEELPDVADQQLGYLHGREMAAALELRPVLDAVPVQDDRSRSSAAKTAIPVGAGRLAPQSDRRGQPRR